MTTGQDEHGGRGTPDSRGTPLPAADEAHDVVTIGETLAAFVGPPAAPLRPGGAATFRLAGAESNVAIAASRLGHRVAYFSRVGDDDIGRLILATLRGEGVDVRGVQLDPEAATSLLVRQHRTSDLVTVSYYRRGGAGSRLRPEDVDADVVERSRLLHVTGITPALSDTACAAVQHAVSVASAAGVTVSLDINHRSRLWSRETAGRTLRALLPSVDVLFGDDDELGIVQSGETPESRAEELHRSGVGQVVLKRGSLGASAWEAGERADQRAVEVSMVDPVGAGDAFVAGYLSALLDGATVEERLQRAVVCGAFAVSVHGDWEGTPRRDELGLLGLAEQVRR